MPVEGKYIPIEMASCNNFLHLSICGCAGGIYVPPGRERNGLGGQGPIHHVYIDENGNEYRAIMVSPTGMRHTRAVEMIYAAVKHSHNEYCSRRR